MSKVKHEVIRAKLCSGDPELLAEGTAELKAEREAVARKQLRADLDELEALRDQMLADMDTDTLH